MSVETELKPEVLERLQAWVDSQDADLGFGEIGPPIYYDDVRAVLAALAGSSAKVEEGEPTIDSTDYRHTFFGIMNGHGALWTPLAFDSPKAARQHIERFWAHDPAKRDRCLETHTVVPVRIRLNVLSQGQPA